MTRSPAYEKTNLRGVDAGVRSLAEAFPEVYEALREVTILAEKYAPSLSGTTTAGAIVERARAILARMRGDTPIAGKGTS